MANPETNADRVKEPVVARKSRVKHRDYDLPEYTPKSYSKSLYGFGKGEGKSIEDTLETVRAEKEAAKKARTERLRKEWMDEPPKCNLSGPSTGGDPALYSIGMNHIT